MDRKLTAACPIVEAIEEGCVRRFQRAKEDGELDASRDLRPLARYFVTQIFGLQLAARGGTERRALEQSADVAVSVLG